MWMLSGDKVILEGPLVGVTVDWATQYSTFNAAERALLRYEEDKRQQVVKRDICGNRFNLHNLVITKIK